jgi:hypothetical protein
MSAPLDEVGFAVGNSTTNLALATGLAGLRMPYAMKLLSIRIGLVTAPTGSAVIVDVKQNGVSLFTTKPEIPSGATTSVGSAKPGVLALTALADNAVITVDVTQVGATTPGAGLEVWLLGTRA